MTIKEIKELVEETKGLTKNEIYNISTHLPIFDACNYALWMDKLHNIKVSL